MNEPESDTSAKRAKLDEDTAKIFPLFDLQNFQRKALYDRMYSYKELCRVITEEKVALANSLTQGSSQGTLLGSFTEVLQTITKINEEHTHELLKTIYGASKTRENPKPASNGALTENEPSKEYSDELQAALDASDKVLRQRTEELSRIQNDLISLRAQCSSLKAHDQHSGFRADMSKLRKELDYKDDKINRLELENDRLYKRKQELSLVYVAKEEESFKRIDDFLDGLQKEIGRYRKERDDMREMYESANAQVSSLTKNCSHLQIMIDGLKAKIQMLESRLGVINSGKFSDESLLEELSSIEKAYESLREHNELLIKECSQKESALSASIADKIKAEFKIAQTLKDTEIQTKKAGEMESLCISKFTQFQSREKTILGQISTLETDLADKSKHIEDLKKKITELNCAVSELERDKRSLKGDLEEPIFIDLKKKYESLTSQYNILRENHELLERKYQVVKNRGPSGPSEVEEELQMYKKLMRCNSCDAREKNSVLAKCMHVFCRKCLEDRIETRQRKCPNCGEAFAASDIRTIYL